MAITEKNERIPFSGTQSVEDEDITTTNSYVSVLKLDVRSDIRKLIRLKNTDAGTDGLKYKILTSAKQKTSKPADGDSFWDGSDDSWEELKAETILAKGDSAVFELETPWSWAILQVKSEVDNNAAKAKVYYRGRQQ